MKSCGEIFFLTIKTIFQKAIDLFIKNLNQFKKILIKKIISLY